VTMSICVSVYLSHWAMERTQQCRANAAVPNTKDLTDVSPSVKNYTHSTPPPVKFMPAGGLTHGAHKHATLVIGNNSKVKGREVDLYSTFIVVPHTQGAQVRITQFYLQITPYLPLPRKHSADGAYPD